jgi:AraC-like DNA-binding protein
MNLEMLDTVLRGIAIGGFLSTMMVMIANGKATPVMWVGVAFFSMTIAHVLDHVIGIRPDGGNRKDILWLAQNIATPLFWAFMLGVFDDTKGRFWPRLIPFAVLAVLNWVNREDGAAFGAYYWTAYHVVCLLMMAHLTYTMLRGVNGDLVEARRQLRLPLLILASAYIGFLAWADLVSRVCCWSTMGWSLLQSGMLAIMGLGCTVGFLRAGPIFWGSRVAQLDAEEATVAPQQSEGVEKALLQRLQRALDEDKIWKREGLTIGTFAHELSIPEYRLRRLINERLGYKNFADFINSHRIEAAKKALSDPAQATLSISQLAYDLGFGSLGPFNRAFKTDTGLSPTEWRAQNLAKI